MKKYKNILLSIGTNIVSILATCQLVYGVIPHGGTSIIPINFIEYIILVIVGVVSSALGIFFAVKAIKLKESLWAGAILTVIGVLLLLVALLFVWFIYLTTFVGRFD
jgi:H+/Cl- antiporter ClcA